MRWSYSFSPHASLAVNGARLQCRCLNSSPELIQNKHGWHQFQHHRLDLKVNRDFDVKITCVLDDLNPRTNTAGSLRDLMTLLRYHSHLPRCSYFRHGTCIGVELCEELFTPATFVLNFYH